jgi:NodT family efflux transporter outer membrane factor (OMF) lipoprotein
MISKQIKYIFLMGIFLLTGFSSCGVFQKYKSPDVSLDGLYRDMPSGDTASVASIPWKRYFTDTNLQSLIAEGLRENFDLRIAYTRIQQSEANLTMLRSAILPTAAITGQATHAINSVKNGETKALAYNSDQFRLGLAAQWELDIWGKLNRQAKAGYANYLGSLTYRNLIQTSLIANIANTYFSLLAMDEQLRITNETVGLLKESSATMQALMDAGLLNAAAVEQSKALLYSTQISIPELENRIRKTENSLCVLLGRKPGAIQRSNLQTQNEPAILNYGVPMHILSNRPDVMQAELNFRAAFELKNAAQAAFYPTITLSSGSMIGYNTGSISDFFKPANLFANIIGGLTQPIFAGNQLRGQLKIRKAQQEEALLNFEHTVLAAGQEVSDIFYTFRSSKQKDDLRNRQIQSLQTAVEYTQELLKAGEANYTEVLSAEQNLLQAKLGQVNDKLEQTQAAVNLYRALGGGVKDAIHLSQLELESANKNN